MKNIELLFSKNGKTNVRPRIINNSFLYKSKSTVLGGNEIHEIIKYVNKLENDFSLNFCKIVFDLRTISKIADKLTYIVLESICYYITVVKNGLVDVLLSEKIRLNIFNDGFRNSILYTYSIRHKQSSCVEFEKNYKMIIYKNHYRRLLTNENYISNSNLLSAIMYEIDIFLHSYINDEECCDDVSATLIEILGNGVEHSESDCLIDIDIEDNYIKENNEDELYYGINIVVIDFSKNLLHDKLREKIYSDNSLLKDRYMKVKNALKVHSKYFCNEYNEQDFFNLASFQDKISGDLNKNEYGGKGLTELIKSLEIRSETNKCYVMSGNGILYFKEKYLKYNTDGWIGFNDANDFETTPPDYDTVVDRSKVYFPGTAYNLNFVIKKEVK